MDRKTFLTIPNYTLSLLFIAILISTQFITAPFLEQLGLKKQVIVLLTHFLSNKTKRIRSTISMLMCAHFDFLKIE